MERKKPVSESSSGSEASSSSEEDEEGKQLFILRGRNEGKADNNKKSAVVAAAEEEDDDDDEDEDDEDEDEDEDEDDDDIDGTQRAKPSATKVIEAGHGQRETESSTETISGSEGKPEKPSHQFVVVPRKAENSKKALISEKLSKARPSPLTSPKKNKDKPSKRDHEAHAEPQDQTSSKKQKKENSEKPRKPEKESKEKSTPSRNGEKKKEAKKPAHAMVVSENGKPAVAAHQISAKSREIASVKKDSEKSKKHKKATKDSESEPVKVSPTKPKAFRPKDELVLTKEILQDIKRGVQIPTEKDDGYWSALVDKLSGWLDEARSNEQLFQKVRRMKVRYTTMAKKVKDDPNHKFRTSTDKELYGLWGQIWGNGDAMEEESEREVSEVKDKQLKILGSQGKGGKSSREDKDKVVAQSHDTKVTGEGAERSENKHIENQSDDADAADGDDAEEHDNEGDSHKKDPPVTPMEVDHKVTHANRALVLKSNAVQGCVNGTQYHSPSDREKLFQEEVQATLSTLQESSKRALKEWQDKALLLVENAVKATADHSRLVNGAGVGACLDGVLTPFRGLSHEGDEALEPQWGELRLRELDLYRQRLELMQKECQLKQDQLRLKLERRK